MTPIVGSRTVVRKTACRVRDGGRARELVVTLYPEFLTLRLHGTRREEAVSYEGAFFGAIKSRVFRERMERAKTRKPRAAVSRNRG